MHFIYWDQYINGNSFNMTENKLFVKHPWISLTPDPINIHNNPLLSILHCSFTLLLEVFLCAESRWPFPTDQL